MAIVSNLDFVIQSIVLLARRREITSLIVDCNPRSLTLSSSLRCSSLSVSRLFLHRSFLPSISERTFVKITRLVHYIMAESVDQVSPLSILLSAPLSDLLTNRHPPSYLSHLFSFSSPNVWKSSLYWILVSGPELVFIVSLIFCSSAEFHFSDPAKIELNPTSPSPPILFTVGLFLGAIRSGATSNQFSYWMEKVSGK